MAEAAENHRLERGPGQCLDPRDRVYGCLHPTGKTRRLPVGYRVSAATVFKACWGVGRYEAREIPGLPSWLPGPSASRRPIWRSRGGGLYCAGGGLTERGHRVDSTGDVLPVQGYEFDAVEELGGSYADMQNGHDLIEVFWCTLIANLPGSSNQPPDAEHWASSFRNFCLLYFAYWKASSASGDDSSHQGDNDDPEAVLDSLASRTSSKWLPSKDEIETVRGYFEAGDADSLNRVIDAVGVYLRSLKSMSEGGCVFFRTRNGQQKIKQSKSW
ncbi:hypothetical protein PG994_002237 [Apiospora phragmitis]|uniref:Uncharacterized protein n=1 Tax=Apiospora phragmitis TaxID=2905665 RepID=A0ABR1WVS8_9PEZI